ncbi:[Protein-PII] uridylyltransferase / [Protein-PII]-UMP uridylyl-removing enzyme, partial [hydrothermal vent metagenome]
ALANENEWIERVLYLLWDMGLKIGPAVRTPVQCRKLAGEDHTIATSMMDLRVLFGSAKSGEALLKSLTKKQTANSKRQFIADKLAERDQRHQRVGPTRYLVEPNVKSGKGGLRDLQSLVWIARHIEPDAFVSGGKKPKFFSAREYRVFARANRFLWTIRCWLHFLSDRDEDRLTFDLQPQLAQKLHYRDTAEKPGVERLMKAYFLTAREVGFLTRVFCNKLEERAAKPAPFRHAGEVRPKDELLPVAGFALQNGRLNFKGRRPTALRPVKLFSLFALADQIGVDIHPDALNHVRTIAGKFGKTQRHNPDAIAAFLHCLVTARHLEGLLRLMSESGLLGKFIPEFGRITAQTQFNMYHSYTVDEHTLRAIGFLQQLETGAMPVADLDMKAILAKSSNHLVLVLALLLHDTGKGIGDQEIEGGKLARKTCKRLGLAPAETELAGWLVENHLLFSDTAQGRDLGDPETISTFAKTVGSLERLRLLLALTIADICAVGPGVWTSWKAQLLANLYKQTEALLLGRTASASAKNTAEQAKAQVKTALGQPRFFGKWSTELDDGYWSEFSPTQLLMHARLVRQTQKAKQENGFELLVGSQNELTSLIVWADDQPGLFAALCQITSACGAGIASARAYTSRSAKAFDVLHLHDGRGGPFAANNARALGRVSELLQQFFDTGELPALVQRSRSRRQAAFSVMREVVIDNQISARATLIECIGADRHGLLASLAQSLNQCRVNIISAHIMTYGERVVDIFYVTEKNGSKVKNRRRIDTIRQSLMQMLKPPKPDQTLGDVQQAPASRHR